MKKTAVQLPPAQSAHLIDEIRALETLNAVISWGRRYPGKVASSAVITDVVVQDEFSHDAIVPLSSGLVVAIGST